MCDPKNYMIAPDFFALVHMQLQKPKRFYWAPHIICTRNQIKIEIIQLYKNNAKLSFDAHYVLLCKQRVIRTVALMKHIRGEKMRKRIK